MSKRDLADLCQEGLLESIEGQQQDRLAALLQVRLHAYVLDDCLMPTRLKRVLVLALTSLA